MSKVSIKTNVTRNLARVKNLAEIYRTKLAGTGSGRRPVNSADVLRAATVLLHATLEDFLRDLCRWKLPSASSNVLQAVPIAGHGRATKFDLGDLVRFRGKSIDDVIVESVKEHLASATYNNVAEVKAALTAIGQDQHLVDPFAEDLGQMMERRHHIVHRADKNESTGVGHYSAKSISYEAVNRWVEKTSDFIDTVLDAL